MPHADVMQVGCPICQSAANHPCTDFKTGNRTKIHNARVAHARAVARYGVKVTRHSSPRRDDDDFDLIER